jgi:hypothetical protein
MHPAAPVPHVDRRKAADHHCWDDPESLHGSVVEKSSRFRGFESARAIVFSASTDPQNPAVWTGFFNVPVFRLFPEEMDQ